MIVNVPMSDYIKASDALRLPWRLDGAASRGDAIIVSDPI